MPERSWTDKTLIVMKAKAEILELGERHSIEAPHVEHVARLALGLFNGFFPTDGLCKADRDLLFAAAYLHDIGYADHPEDHVLVGAQILADHPLPGFTSGDWSSIIAIALLHKRDWHAVLEHECFLAKPEKELERIKKMAAMLRIADGLDHGHIQDAGILYCRRGRKVDKVGVRCRWYKGNIPWAEGKADLWEAVFKRPLRLEGRFDRNKTLFEGVVHKNDSAISAARKILYSQYDVMRDNVSGMLEGRGPEHLHDYRVAMRRFRAALRMFKPLLDGTCSPALGKALAGLSDRLGPVRDAHVALQLLRSLDSPEDIPSGALQTLEAAAAEADTTLKDIIGSDSCLQTVQAMNRFLRIELPALERSHTGLPFRAFAKKRLYPLLKRIAGLDITPLHEDDPQLHRFRKLCRRGRYYAEFSTPVPGRRAHPAAQRLKTVAGALGDVRDARWLKQHLGPVGDASPVLQREKEAWKKFSAGWGEFAGSIDMSDQALVR